MFLTDCNDKWGLFLTGRSDFDSKLPKQQDTLILSCILICKENLVRRTKYPGKYCILNRISTFQYLIQILYLAQSQDIFPTCFSSFTLVMFVNLNCHLKWDIYSSSRRVGLKLIVTLRQLSKILTRLTIYKVFSQNYSI